MFLGQYLRALERMAPFGSSVMCLGEARVDVAAQRATRHWLQRGERSTPGTSPMRPAKNGRTVMRERSISSDSCLSSILWRTVKRPQRRLSPGRPGILRNLLRAPGRRGRPTLMPWSCSGHRHPGQSIAVGPEARSSLQRDPCPTPATYLALLIAGFQMHKRPQRRSGPTGDSQPAQPIACARRPSRMRM